MDGNENFDLKTMKSQIIPLLALLAATLLSNAKADDHDFTVSIVGLKQINNPQDKADGLTEGTPIVVCPVSTSRRTNDMADDKLSHCFFVFIQNVKHANDKISMWNSEWSDCLQIKITTSSGKVYSIHRWPAPYTVNGVENWTFSRGGIRIIPLDFTNLSATGWEGQPEAPSTPELVTVTATFNYYRDPATRKVISISSKPTQVYLSRY
jgi:hypothetical protein